MTPCRPPGVRPPLSTLQVLTVLLCAGMASAFAPFGRPSFQTRSAAPLGAKNDEATGGQDENPWKKLTLGGVLQLIAMGAGSPMLGDFKEVDENGRLIFELEANNFADSDGNTLETKAKYFDRGYVPDSDDDKNPGFWENLLSGGRLQREADERYRQRRQQGGGRK